jgi:hypothetical protein
MKLIPSCFFSFIVTTTLVQAEVMSSVKVCGEDSQWFPHVFTSQGKPAGIQVRLTEEAFKAANIGLTIRLLPWKRCLQFAESGMMDAIIGASYNTERSAYLYYPDDAELAQREQRQSKHALALVRYVVITPKELNYQYTGNPQSLPQNVLLPLGFSLADELIAMGIAIDSTGKRDIDNLHRLAMYKQGSTIVIEALVRHALKNELGNKLSISEKPYTYKNNYLAFSKRSKTPANIRQQLWQSIATVNKSMGETIELEVMALPFEP